MNPLRFMVAGEERECPRELWKSLLGPLPADEWGPCDGCTASPDEWRGIALWPACRVHDFHCSTGIEPRIVADLKFRINIWRCLRYGRAPLWRALGVATLYWLGVRGGAAVGIGKPERKRAA
jgi:hypothetical protein